MIRSAALRSLAAVVLVAGLVAGCGGASKQPPHTATGPPVSKSTYESKAVGVLRPMLRAINTALGSPHKPGVWQQLQNRATGAYQRIGSVSPPSGISSLHQQLLRDLHRVSSTAGGLFHALSSNDLHGVGQLGGQLVQEGRQITGLGNQFKAHGYSEVGAILAGP